METLTFGLSVSMIGMLVVFAGLIILVFCIRGISWLSTEKTITIREEAEVAAQTMNVAHPTAFQGVAPEVVAAITAAIATVWQGEQGFVVRHIKHINNAPAWNRAGREEQTYSRF